MSKSNKRKFRLQYWFLETLGLDWVLIVFFNKDFPKAARPGLKRQTEIKELAANLTDVELEIVVEKYESLLADEDKNRIQIESKAFSLLGITSVASGFIIGFSQFLLNSSSFPIIIQWIVVILYVLIGFSLVMIILLAWRAVIPGKEYVFMAPNPLDLIYLTDGNKDEIFQQRVRDLLISYENNEAISIDKTTYVRGAQDWFRNSIILLLFLLVPLAISSTPPLNNPTTDSSPVKVIILTPTYTSTNTPSPTQTPSATLTLSPSQAITPSPISKSILTPPIPNLVLADRSP